MPSSVTASRDTFPKGEGMDGGSKPPPYDVYTASVYIVGATIGRPLCRGTGRATDGRPYRFYASLPPF